MQTLMRKQHITFGKASLVGGFFVPTLFALQLFIAGCTPPQKGDVPKVFRYNEPAGIPTLDPAFAKDKSTIWGVQQIFEGLVALDEHNVLVPALAERWEMSTDGTNYTFYLRPAVFHNGSPLTAADVMYSLQRLLDPSVASPGSWVLADVANMEVLDEHTVRIALKRPNSTFLSLLAMPYCSIMPEDAENPATEPVGAGPFKFHRWHVGEKLVLHKNESYWKSDAAGNALPYLDGVSVSFLPDQQSAFLEFLSGRFEIVPNLDPSFKDELLDESGQLRAKHREDLYLERTPFLNTEYLIFNAESALPYELRWAINAAIDREQMITSLRNGVGIPAKGGVIPAGLPEAKDCGITYDPDSAAKVFASFEVLPELELVTVANYRDLCEFVQGALSRAGWEIKVNVVPSATLRAEKSAGTLNFFRASWIADFPDAENYLMLFYSGMKAPGGPNYSRYSNAEFDALYEQIIRLEVGAERSELIAKADALLMQDAALVPLFYDEVLRVFPNHVQGVKTNALNSLDLREAKTW